MRTILPILFILFLPLTGAAQKKLDRTIRVLNNETVPYLQTSEVPLKDSLVFLDTRSKIEYSVSHLKNAIWVGYDTFDPQIVTDSLTDKSTPIVVYCSIGVRSEDIGEKLQQLGYTNVKNLYGGIFKWKNDGYPVFDQEQKETENVHAFDKVWGKFLTKGEKVYD